MAESDDQPNFFSDETSINLLLKQNMETWQSLQFQNIITYGLTV